MLALAFVLAVSFGFVLKIQSAEAGSISLNRTETSGSCVISRAETSELWARLKQLGGLSEEAWNLFFGRKSSSNVSEPGTEIPIELTTPAKKHRRLSRSQ